MSDVLQQLRELNPVDRSSLIISDELRDRALADHAPRRKRNPRRLRLIVLAASAVVSTMVLLIAGGRDGAPDLATRAYAATTGPGVIHWRTDLAASLGGKVGSRQRTEGWARNGVTHELRYDVIHGKAILQSDARSADGHTTIWTRSEDNYLRVPDGPAGDASNPLQSGDPFAIFRRAYRAGKLKEIAPNRFHVDLPGRSNDNDDPSLIYYDIDPRTALPIRLVVRTPSRTSQVGSATVKRAAVRTVMTFAIYERLAFNQSTRRRLRLLPHPTAGPKDTVAAEHFAILRTGEVPDAVGIRALRNFARMATRMNLEPDAARALRPGTYLLPGRGYLCLVIVNDKGSGGGCKAVDEVIKRGLGSGVPGERLRLVVPDGVIAISARLRGKRYARVPVHGNLARPPIGTYAWQFLR